MPHVGESDTDKLAEIPGKPTEMVEVSKEKEEEEVDEFGYNWSEFSFVFAANTVCTAVNLKGVHGVNKMLAFCNNETETNDFTFFQSLI